jgi:hypothetical protein
MGCNLVRFRADLPVPQLANRAAFVGLDGAAGRVEPVCHFRQQGAALGEGGFVGRLLTGGGHALTGTVPGASATPHRGVRSVDVANSGQCHQPPSSSRSPAAAGSAAKPVDGLPVRGL